MGKLLTILILASVGCASAFGQCSAIISGRPRIYLPNTAYGSNATVLARLQAAKTANSTEWQAILADATTYLTSNNFFSDQEAAEEALVYQMDTTTYAANGARAMFFLNEAVQAVSPTVDITAATNANPAVFTTSAAHGLGSGSHATPVWGGTGSWAAFNLTSNVIVTVIDATHFSIPIDSTSFGAYPGNMTATTGGFTSLNAARWNLPPVVQAWDWAHAQIAGNLTTAQQNEIKNTLVSAAYYVAANPHEWSGATPNPTGGVGNLITGPFAGALQTAVAMSGDVAGVSAICDTLRANFITLAPIYTTGATGTLGGTAYKIFPEAKGGAYVESTTYGAEAYYYLFAFLETMLSGTGENMYSYIGTFPQEYTQYLHQGLSPAPGAFDSVPELYAIGDSAWSASNHHTLNAITREALGEAALYMCRTGDSTNCGYAQWWLQNKFTSAQGISEGNYDSERPKAAEFLHYDPNITAIDPRTIYGPDYIASGIGLFFSRSSQASTATWIGFKGGGQRGNDSDHAHSDVLSFGIYRNGDWLTNNMLQSGGAILARENNEPIVKNNQFGLAYEGPNAPSSPHNNGLDWGTTGMVNDATITQSEFNTGLNYAFAQADATVVYRGLSNSFTSPAYTATINTVIRDLLYLKPDTFIIFDRLAYDSPYAAEWNIQALQNPGTPTGNSFTLGSYSNTQALNVYVVSPTSPTYTVATPATQATEIGSLGCPSGAGVGCGSQWRVEITSGNTVSSEQYFMVMQAGASGFTPATVTALTATNAKAAQFNGYVVGGMTDTSQTGVTRSYNYSTAAPVQHIFMGLSPTQVYKVDTVTVPGTATISDAGSGSSVTTTSGGILLFSTGSGGGLLGGPSVTLSNGIKLSNGATIQ